MDRLKIFRIAMNDYIENYDVFNDFRADGKEVKGANSTFGEINKVIKSIYYSKESDDIKKQNLTSFKNYIKAVNSKRVLDIKTETFKLIYNIIFLEQANSLELEELVYYISYMEKLFKSGITEDMLSLGLDKEKELAEFEEKRKKEKEIEEKKKKEEEEKERQEKEKALREEKLLKMGEAERFKFELDELKTDDEKEKYVTDKFSQLKTMQESEERKLLAKVVIKYYKDKEKPSKKVKKKIEELEKML